MSTDVVQPAGALHVTRGTRIRQLQDPSGRRGHSRRTFLISGLAFAPISAALANVEAAASSKYSITGLGVVPGWSSVSAMNINQLGQVTGYGHDVTWPGHEAFLWTFESTDGPPKNPRMRILGNFKGEPASLWYGSEAFAVNNKGQAVGWANGTDLLVDTWRACLWQNGKIIDLGSLSPYGASMARSINDNGWITGMAVFKPGSIDENRHAFLYNIPNRKMTDLGVHYSHANSINAWGEIAGGYYNAQGRLHALYFDRNRRAWDLHSIVTLGGTRSEAAMINNKGQVVGWTSDNSGVDHGFFYDINTRAVKHVTLPDETRITSINNQGIAVGMYKKNALWERALIWNVNTGVAEDLNNRLRPEDRLPDTSWPPPQKGWALLQAWGVNDAGQITGSGTSVINGYYYQRSYRLTPIR